MPNMMSSISRVLVLLVATATCFASEPVPADQARERYEQILNEVRQEPSLSRSALDLLRAVAESRGEDVASDAAVRFGFDAGEFKDRKYKFMSSRGPALWAIGELGTPEAVAYLESLQQADFDPRDEFELWATVQRTLLDLTLDQIPSEAEKARYLEGVIREGTTAFWAAARLCETGMLSSFPVVDQYLRTRNPQRGAENAQFCEARMGTLASNPDRITALSSVLQVTNGLADEKLTMWAIRSLTAMESPRADEIMERYEQQVLDLPDGSPQKRELMPYADAVRNRKGPRPR